MFRLLLIAAVYGCAEPSIGPDAQATDLRAVLESTRAKHRLPALAAAMYANGKVTQIGAAGSRQWGADAPVQDGDKWHIGSITKSMTATLIAMLVEEGKLKWDTTLSEVFPDLVSKPESPFAKATLLHVLSHHAGFSGAGLPAGGWRGESEKPMRARRLEFVAACLAEKPIAGLGEKFEYSNRGYVVAGAIVERVTGKDWEAVISERLFKPLALSSAGFGHPGAKDKVDQPRPHQLVRGEPVAVSPQDNPAVIGPAGVCHMSIQDLAKWGGFAASSGQGLLKPETMAKLRTRPYTGQYALGWLTVHRAWGGGMVINHAGSNTLNFAVVWAAPEKGIAVAVATNIAGDAAPRACDEVAAALVSSLVNR